MKFFYYTEGAKLFDCEQRCLGFYLTEHEAAQERNKLNLRLQTVLSGYDDFSYHATDMNVKKRNSFYYGDFITRKQAEALALHQDRSQCSRVLYELEEQAMQSSNNKAFASALDDVDLIVEYIGGTALN